MAPNSDTDHEHQNTSDSTSNPSVDDELVTHEDESIPSVAMQDQDHTNIMHELATLVGSNRNTVQEFINDMVGNTDVPTSQSKPSMPESTLHRISKIVMKETVRDKMLELIQSDKKIPENDVDVLDLINTWDLLIQSGKMIPENNVDVLDLINTSDLYEMINEGINKHYQRDAAKRVTNDIVNITNVSTTAHSNNVATYAGQEEINHPCAFIFFELTLNEDNPISIFTVIR